MDNKVFLFQLNNSVLFKKVTLPFHIFEPKYRQMIRDSIELQIPIAVVPSKIPNNYRDTVCVAGMPHIMTTYPDGRMDVYITGLEKCRLADFIHDRPYVEYSFKPLEEDNSIDDSFSLELDSLKKLLEKWAGHFLADPAQRKSFSDSLKDSELLINYCAVFLLDDIDSKRQVMTLSSFKDKTQVLLKQIGPKEIALGPFMPTLKF